MQYNAADFYFLILNSQLNKLHLFINFKIWR